MPRRTGRRHDLHRAVEDACTASDLLEVLSSRHRSAVPSGAVSAAQLRALLVVERRERTNLRSLGDALGSRAPSVSRLCDRMEAMGLVERVPSPTSRREVELRLRVRGRTLLEEYRAIRTSELVAIVERMEPEAVAALCEGLAAFRAAASERIAEDGA